MWMPYSETRSTRARTVCTLGEFASNTCTQLLPSNTSLVCPRCGGCVPSADPIVIPPVELNGYQPSIIEAFTQVRSPLCCIRCQRQLLHPTFTPLCARVLNTPDSIQFSPTALQAQVQCLRHTSQCVRPRSFYNPACRPWESHRRPRGADRVVRRHRSRGDVHL